ncbi:MAG: amidohydrolase family protein [Gemmatimonadetes bacterium]|nr:amidohydrolase family protein [Gemmatimonadota bacterium]
MQPTVQRFGFAALILGILGGFLVGCAESENDDSVAWSELAESVDYVLKSDLAIDGQGNTIVDPLILIRGNRIREVRANARPPSDFEVINLRGYTLLPGLIDTHVHIAATFDQDAGDERLALKAAGNARSLLISGFTTVRSLGAPDAVALALRDAISEGLVVGSRLLVSGAGMTDRGIAGTEGDRVREGAKPATEADIRKWVRQKAESDVDAIKVFATRSSRAGGTAVYSQEQLDWAADEARKYGKPLAVHAHAADGVQRAIRAGARTVEHGALLDDQTLELMVQQGIYYAPNLYLPEYYLEHAQRFGFSEEEVRYTREFLPIRTAVLTKAVQKGVRIVFSTDATSGWIWSGETALEFERRHRAGQPPKEAIISATTRAAEALFLDDRGDLKPGLLADIIAVDGNPLEDITALQRVVFVMQDGKIHRHPGRK